MHYKNYKIIHKNLNFLYISSHVNPIYGHAGSHGVQIRSKLIDYRTINQGGFYDGSV